MSTNVTQGIQHGKRFFVNHEGERFRCTVEDVGFSYAEVRIEELIEKRQRLYVLFGPHVTRKRWKTIFADGYDYQPRALDRRMHYPPEEIKQRVLKIVNVIRGSVHTEEI